MADQRLDQVIAAALLEINTWSDTPIIPPTAINWIAPEIATAVHASPWLDAVIADARAGVYDPTDGKANG